MLRPLVFVGGVHGSGKTTLCRFLAAALPAAHVTAGSLIREAAAPNHVVTVGAQNKAVPNVDTNQELLLRGLAAYQARTVADDLPCLLDGHFTLMDPFGRIVDVPTAVFAAIRPVALLLVESNADVVHRRLKARAADASSTEVIARLAGRERARAVASANGLNIPIFTLAGDGLVEQEGHALMGSLRRLLGGAA